MVPIYRNIDRNNAQIWYWASISWITVFLCVIFDTNTNFLIKIRMFFIDSYWLLDRQLMQTTLYADGIANTQLIDGVMRIQSTDLIVK